MRLLSGICFSVIASCLPAQEATVWTPHADAVIKTTLEGESITQEVITLDSMVVGWPWPERLCRTTCGPWTRARHNGKPGWLNVKNQLTGYKTGKCGRFRRPDGPGSYCTGIESCTVSGKLTFSTPFPGYKLIVYELDGKRTKRINGNWMNYAFAGIRCGGSVSMTFRAELWQGLVRLFTYKFNVDCGCKSCDPFQDGRNGFKWPGNPLCHICKGSISHNNPDVFGIKWLKVKVSNKRTTPGACVGVMRKIDGHWVKVCSGRYKGCGGSVDVEISFVKTKLHPFATKICVMKGKKSPWKWTKVGCGLVVKDTMTFSSTPCGNMSIDMYDVILTDDRDNQWMKFLWAPILTCGDCPDGW